VLAEPKCAPLFQKSLASIKKSIKSIDIYLMSDLTSLPENETATAAPSSELLLKIQRSLAGIDYGSVEIVIHDSRVVQIERNRKTRFRHPLEIPSL